MGITFTPYVALGLGSSVRKLTYEFDNARMLRIKGPIAEVIETIPLEGASAERNDTGGFVSNIFAKSRDIGDVVITRASGVKKLCPNIKGIQAFMQAVEGTHPDVQPLTPPGPPWYEGKQLENFEIRMPKVNRFVFSTLNVSLKTETHKRHLSALFSYPNDKDSSGAYWIKRDQPIYDYDGLKILSPCTGKVTFHGVDVGATDWSNDLWPIPKNEYTGLSNSDYLGNSCLVAIQPVKGTNIYTNLASCYGSIIYLMEHTVENQREHKAFYNFLRQNDKDVSLIISRMQESIQELKRAKFRKGPVSTESNKQTPISEMPPEVSL